MCGLALSGQLGGRAGGGTACLRRWMAAWQTHRRYPDRRGTARIGPEGCRDCNSSTGRRASPHIRVRAVGEQIFIDMTVAVSRMFPFGRVSAIKEEISSELRKQMPGAQPVITTDPVALNTETILDRVMVIARNRALAAHHVTVHELKESLRFHWTWKWMENFHCERPMSWRMVSKPQLLPSFVQGSRWKRTSNRCNPLTLQAGKRRVSEFKAVAAALLELATGEQHIRDVHDVRVRETDEGEIVNFHCRIDPELSVQSVHENVDALERALKQQSASIKRVIGHAEPTR